MNARNAERRESGREKHVMESTENDMSNAWREEGVVRMWSPERMFGFIRAEGAKDRFFHLNDCGYLDPADLRTARRVSFVPLENERGPRAVDVRVDDDESSNSNSNRKAD